LAIKSLIDIFKDSPNIYNISLYGLLILAISVSIDSFSTGLGLRAITNNYILASSIFSVFSCLFSILGYIIGSYFGKKCGSYASLIGSFLLIVLGIANLFK
jgi:putative Mn2+ efflux pump MntP